MCDLKAVLVAVLLERRRRVDADREDRDAAPRELVVIVAHLAKLGRARAREGEREKREENRPAAERRQASPCRRSSTSA